MTFRIRHIAALTLWAFLGAACLPAGTEGDGSGGSGGANLPDPEYDNPCTDGALDAPIQGCAPAMLESTGDPKEDCVRRINQLRWECQCLPPLQRWTDGEACADEQAAYDASKNSAHAGFSDRICSPGGRGQNECPGWGSWESANEGCLQMMWDEGPGEPFSEHGHYLNMTNASYTMVACGEGDGWFIQNFQ